MGSQLQTELGSPVAVAHSAPGETRWGFHQFPALSRLPDGRILLMYADAEDASESHGLPAPACVSSDRGASWQPFSGTPQPVRPHFSSTELPNGDRLVVPAIHYFNITEQGIVLPAPAATANVYGEVCHYRLSDLPEPVKAHFRSLKALRWTPATGEWAETHVQYDNTDQLVWKRSNSDLLPRTFFERSALPFADEVLYPDYRVRYAMPDGTILQKGATHLMVSTDNGQRFTRRSVVAADPSGKDLYGEPTLAPTADGRLVSVIRRADQAQKPMAIVWSDDHGHTWSRPQDFCEFGVWPVLELLGNGILVLAYGRPGVHLRFAADGKGEDWSEPLTLIEGRHDAVMADSCGYTSALSLTDDTFLFTWSDFKSRNEAGEPCKTIFARTVTVRPR